MALIDPPVEVLIGDGKLLFQHPDHRTELALAAFGKKEVTAEDGTKKEEYDEDLAADQLWGFLVGVENFQRSDGQPVTVESLRAREHSKAFLRAAIRGYSAAMVKALSGERSDAKNG